LDEMVEEPTMTPFASVTSICDGIWYSVVEPFAATERKMLFEVDDAIWKRGRVGYVVVACMAKDANGVDVPMPTRWPPASEMASASVEVAHLESKVGVLASVPQYKTPPVVDFTSQFAAERLVMAKVVVVAFVVVALVKMLLPVKTLSVYVFGIVEDA
jgi:hypothetical protein